MNERDSTGGTQALDVGEYCRLVEDHLTRVNGGHLVRIVGPGFELVRQWAERGIPASIVFRGIDLKAERHHAGRAKRPLRIEFCEADVREVYRTWRRAIGLTGDESLNGHEDSQPDAPGGATPGASEDRETRKRSLTRDLDRAVDRLTRAIGRNDIPDALRPALDEWLQGLVDLRDAARKARGAAREELPRRVETLNAGMTVTLRSLAPEPIVADVRREAESELAGYRGRLSPPAWHDAVTANTDRLLRERYGLPV
ncbi:MAG: hypothetical protein ACM4AI_18245 [Acidobacteriota bacterium]